MSQPFVCCICLAHAHPEFVERTRRCFAAQFYPFKELIVCHTNGMPGSIGKLRNFAVGRSLESVSVEVIAHFDYDDWSDPDRLSQQVALMELTGRPVVGYRDMLFMDTTRDKVTWYDSKMRDYALGTSLMYRREVWEKTPFPDQTPEDTTWQHQVGSHNIASISSIKNGRPMMIQTIHGGNAAASTHGAIFQQADPENDRIVREILKSA